MNFRLSLLPAVAAIVLAFAPALQAAQPVELASGSTPNHPRQPQVAIDEAGGIHVVYGAGEHVFYRRSDDGGKTFSQTTELPQIANMSLGMRRGPRVAAGKGFVCVTAIGGKQGKGRDGEIFAYRSEDGGKTWLGPVTVNDEPAAAREGLHAMAAGPKGELCCVWLDLRSKGTKLVGSTSTDGGRTWTKNLLVYESPDGKVCECCHPSVTFDSQGWIYVMWRNLIAGNRDLYYCISADGGKSFAFATKLGTGAWPLNACPMDGGAIAALAPGVVATAWRREKSIYLTIPGDSEERLLGPGEQAWIAATAAGPYAVWLKKRGESLQLLAPGQERPVELATQAGDPMVAAPAGGRGPVVAAWEGRNGNKFTVMCQVIAGQ
jgi:hypothetical protein